MTKAEIPPIFERSGSWPFDRQARAAAVLPVLVVREPGAYELSDEELAAIEEAEAEADPGEFATDDEVKALFDRSRHR